MQPTLLLLVGIELVWGVSLSLQVGVHLCCVITLVLVDLFQAVFGFVVVFILLFVFTKMS